MLHQMEALEAEQNHIDNRAGIVEQKLRQLMETGKVCRDGQYTKNRINSAIDLTFKTKC